MQLHTIRRLVFAFTIIYGQTLLAEYGTLLETNSSDKKCLLNEPGCNLLCSQIAGVLYLRSFQNNEKK